MLKRIPFVLFMLCISLATAGAYTVVMKNGKTLTGTLVSETEQTMIFKDSSGIQYSLKKSNLDLDKMRDANAPKMEAPPALEPPAATPETPKKKARVYTKEDVETLRSKYPELSLGEPVENPEDFEAGVLKPEAYAKRIQQGASAISNNLSTLVELREGAATAWEVAASTGKDPVAAVNGVLTGEKGVEILKGVSEDLTMLGRWQDSMSAPPEDVKPAYTNYVNALTALSDFQRSLREWNTFENVNLFRSRLSELENQIQMAVSQIQSAAPPPAPEETEPEAQTTEDQQPPTP